jgi:hypothetical protein
MHQKFIALTVLICIQLYAKTLKAQFNKGSFKLYDMALISDMFNINLKPEEISVINRMAHADSGTRIESGGSRRLVALICVKEGDEKS